MSINAQWDDALLEMSRVHHIKAEFGDCPYKLAVEIIRLRQKLGETVCPVYAAARPQSHDIDDSMPF